MAEGVKRCKKCGLEKPVSAFYVAYSSTRNPTSPCKRCCKEDVDKWRGNNAATFRSICRSWRRKNRDKEFSKRFPEKENAKTARYRALKKQAVPKWSNKQYIDDMYMLAQLVSEFTGEQYHVDHIVPLRSRVVCGLHVEHNLQVISAALNQKKNNRVWPDMP